MNTKEGDIPPTIPKKHRENKRSCVYVGLFGMLSAVLGYRGVGGFHFIGSVVLGIPPFLPFVCTNGLLAGIVQIVFSRLRHGFGGADRTLCAAL